METYWVRFHYKDTDTWGRVKIAKGSMVDRALNGEEGEEFDRLRLLYDRHIG